MKTTKTAARTKRKKWGELPPLNASDAHLRIEKSSRTWEEVLIFCRARIARARAILDNQGAPMVDIRIAQGDVGAVKALLKMAYPDEDDVREAVPELYASGGPD